MRVLVACEFSGRVREAFAKRGHEAWSCDLLPSELPGNHHQGDVLELLDEGWDLLIGHPPCTYLSDAGRAHWHAPGRAAKREAAFEFFMKIMNAPAERIAVENPKSSHINDNFRRADQYVHPYYFGERCMKRTGLWLKNLPRLAYSFEDDLLSRRSASERPEPVSIDKVTYRVKRRYTVETIRNDGHRAHERSRTFIAIAEAMAEQWGNLQPIPGNTRPIPGVTRRAICQ